MKDKVYNSIPLIDKYGKETKEYILLVIERLYQMGKLDNCDTGGLALLAREYELFNKLQNDYLSGKIPFTIKGNKGITVVNPLINLIRLSEMNCLRIMLDFGLTAKSRKALTKSDTKTAQTNSIIDEFAK